MTSLLVLTTACPLVQACVCVCARACVRACVRAGVRAGVRACVRACVFIYLIKVYCRHAWLLKCTHDIKSKYTFVVSLSR